MVQFGISNRSAPNLKGYLGKQDSHGAFGKPQRIPGGLEDDAHVQGLHVHSGKSKEGPRAPEGAGGPVQAGSENRDGIVNCLNFECAPTHADPLAMDESFSGSRCLR